MAEGRRAAGWPLTLVTVLLVVLIGTLAGCSLHILLRLHRRLAHADAARAVLDEGRLLATQLAAQPVVQSAEGTSEEWQDFKRQVSSLYTVQNGLQYVSVSKDGVTVFQHQLTSIDGEPEPATGMSPVESVRDVRMTRRLLRLPDGTIPVVVFATRFTGEDGQLRLIEVALRKEAVDREERATAAAIGSMFRLSLITSVVAFAICIGVVAWMMHREHRREAQRREEEHLAFAGVLANGIVHDFRNPMSSMRLDVQMLDREVGRGADARPGRIAELASRVRDTIDRLDKVFQEFLYISKPPSADRETIDFKVCLAECLSMLAPRLEGAEVRVEEATPQGLVQVVAYQASLQRALMNVITNAEQHSRRGDVIRLRVSRVGKHVQIDIVDNGPGIPVSEHERVFEMFHTTRPGGTGLGLFLARAAIERCGGSIVVVAREEKGACFRITLQAA